MAREPSPLDASSIPIPPSRARKQRGAGSCLQNSLLRLLEIADTAEIVQDVPADVSENKHKYLADAYAGDVADNRYR